jgi:replicative DNA helicase
MNTEFEYILLKKLTHSGDFFGKVFTILKKKYFGNIGNQELFSLINEYYGKYRNIPTLTELVAMVKDVSNSEVRSEIIESLQKISKTDEVDNITFMLEETLEWVKDALYMESLQVGSDGLMKKDDALKLKAQQLMDERAKISIDSDLGLDFDDLDTMIEYYSARMVGIKTQHKQLNYRLGPGFLPGTLSVILAAQGIGKSLLMTDLISGMIKENKNILLVSLEMADKEIMKRVHANAMNLPINSLIDLSKTEDELQRTRQGVNGEPGRDVLTKEMVIAAYNKMKTEGTTGKLFVKDYPTGTFSPLMLEHLVESYKIEKNIEFDIVFIDYLGIMKSDILSPSAGLYSYVKSIGEETRAVAKKLSIPIVSASQLNRASVNEISNADNSNISDSLGTAMTADFMLFLLQNEELKEKCEIVAKCTKNRFTGRTDTWLMNIDYEHMRFNDMIVQSAVSDAEFNISPQKDSPINDDFGIITAKKQQDAEVFANNEVRDIIRDDYKNLSNESKKTTETDPFNDLDSIYKELGL